MSTQYPLFDVSPWPKQEGATVLDVVYGLESRVANVETLVEHRLRPLQAQLDGAEAECDVLRTRLTEAGEDTTAMLVTLVAFANAKNFSTYQSVDMLAPFGMSTVVFVDLPSGQVRWNVPDDDRLYFVDLPLVEPFPSDGSDAPLILARLRDPWTYRPVVVPTGRDAA